MRRDREWMYQRLKGKYVSSEFLKKLEEFIKFACGQEEYIKERRLRCPCSKCMNTAYRDVDTVRMHLFMRGFRDDYYCWTHHGEPYVEVEVEAITSESTSSKGVSNPYQDMVIDGFGPRVQQDSNNAVEDPLPEAKEFFNMLEAAGKPMYDGCEMSMLSVAARIINLKCEYNIPHRAVDGIASLIRDVCPTDNSMPETYYNTRKLLAGLELPHKKIDVCPDGCMLFWKEYIGLDKCLICNKDRYKSKKTKGKPIANKVLTYLPITPRLQRLYAAQSTAEQMRWHAENVFGIEF